MAKNAFNNNSKWILLCYGKRFASPTWSVILSIVPAFHYDCVHLFLALSSLRARLHHVGTDTELAKLLICGRPRRCTVVVFIFLNDAMSWSIRSFFSLFVYLLFTSGWHRNLLNPRERLCSEDLTVPYDAFAHSKQRKMMENGRWSTGTILFSTVYYNEIKITFICLKSHSNENNVRGNR